jgi:hypothetical protein
VLHRILLLAGFVSILAAEIPPAVMAEDDLEKRSEVALKAAEESISAAAKAYSAGSEVGVFRQHITSAQDLTALSLKSLNDSGKRASRSPKYFKRAELKLRSLLRRMTNLSNEVSVEDRPVVEAAQKSMSDVHEQLLHDIMSKK